MVATEEVAKVLADVDGVEGSTSKQDRTVAFLHMSLVRGGFRSLAGKETCAEWKESDSLYKMEFTHEQAPGSVFCLTVVSMGEQLIANAAVRSPDGKTGNVTVLQLAAREKADTTWGDLYTQFSDDIIQGAFGTHLAGASSTMQPEEEEEERPRVRDDPLRIPTRQDRVRPPLYDPETGMEVGIDDLNPLGRTPAFPAPPGRGPRGGGGMEVGPNHPIFQGGPHGPQGPGFGIPGVRRPPPGARFDPIGPMGPGGPFAGPNPDHLRPSGFYDSMYM